MTGAAARAPIMSASEAPASGAASPGVQIYVAVSLAAGAIIALQIAVMRVFAVGSWAHFGSLVVSLALFGFGLSSVVVFIARAWFERHWRGAGGVALFLFGPLTVLSNLVAQTVPFNAIFLVSDPSQIWRLLANFLLYLLPFLAGATFLGIVFLRARRAFGRIYFADLSGSGVAGLVILGAMYLLPPEQLIAVPLVMWTIAAIVWVGAARMRGAVATAALGVAVVASYLWLPGVLGVPDIAVSQYKGVAYARNFPDAVRLYRSVSPFGDLQVYASSYMHFSPGLSDNAAFNLPELPGNMFVAMYVDGEGPEGIMRDPSADYANYFQYLPMHFPYVVKQHPRTFVEQFGGGISSRVALHGGSTHVTVAENNPDVLAAFQAPAIRDAASNLLNDPRVTVIPYDGRLFLEHTKDRYDVIDLSLADSVGLSNPGGFAITEKYAYTTEAMLDYMRALDAGGILSITAWNKEEPPKSILKLYATIVAAARLFDPQSVASSFFVSSEYLSTTTILYRRGGFTPEEVAALRRYTSAMSWDEVYSPGLSVDTSTARTLLSQYRASIFGSGAEADPTVQKAGPADAANPSGDPTGPVPDAADPTGPSASNGSSDTLPATTLGRIFWQALVANDRSVSDGYVFSSLPLTDARPYFAAYEKVPDLPATLDRLDLFQDDWGYLVLWATLGVAATCALVLIVIPMVVGWREVFAHVPGKIGALVFFAALGLGYISVEVGLISRFTRALSNPTISASVLIASMLVFSGLGSLASERVTASVRQRLFAILLIIAALLVGYALLLDPVLGVISGFVFPVRLLLCFLLVAPPAFLMGFPMATAMGALTQLGKDRLFVWAWGINGCFSVIGAAAVPLVATTFGLPAVLLMSALAYMVAVPAFRQLLRPLATA